MPNPKLRYMVDRVAVLEKGAVQGYRPIGVWVQTEAGGLDVYYLPGIVPQEQEGWRVINSLVDRGISVLPDGFLEHHMRSQSPYHGARGPIMETDAYRGADQCGTDIIAKLMEGSDR